MGNTSFTVLRSARDERLAPPRTQFAELTGAYWLEPIYAGLANEWNRQGRTVPGTPREEWRVLEGGSRDAEAAEAAEAAEVTNAADAPDVAEERAEAADGQRGDPGTEVPG